MHARTSASVVTVAIIAAAIVAIVGHDIWRGHRIASLPYGMTKAAVAKQVGEPDVKSNEPIGLFFNCSTGKVKECWVYRCRFGQTYSVAFDASGRVVCVGEYTVVV